MSRQTFLLLPVLALLALDPARFDTFALKSLALLLGAVLCLAASRRTAWTSLSWPVLAVVLATGHGLAMACAFHGAVDRRFLRKHAPLVLGWVGIVLATWCLVDRFGPARQAAATFANRNFAGAGLAMLLPFALSWRWPAGLVVAGGLVATGSRGGMLAGACAFGLWLVWTRGRLRWAVLAVPLVVLAGGLAVGDSNTVKVRLHWYRAAWQMGLDSPWTGVGDFAAHYPPMRPEEEYAISAGRRVHAVHNDYLQSWADRGLPGLLAHLWLLGAAAWAARRSRVAAASLLAFAVAALVDLPLQDPSLLALAFVPLAMVARRRAGRLPGAVPALALLWFLPPAYGHWRADEAVARHFRDGSDTSLDQALRYEPGNADALEARGTDEDLKRLLETRPHDARALRRFAGDDVDKLRAILRDHDPWDTATFCRLALLLALRFDDDLQAVDLLHAAQRANPSDYRPYLGLATVHRRGGRTEEAARFLRQAEQLTYYAPRVQVRSERERRQRFARVARERLRFELDEIRAGRLGQKRIRAAVRRIPTAEVLAVVRDALANAARIEARSPPPRFARRDGETPGQAVQRFDQEKSEWRRDLADRTRGEYLVAWILAEELSRVSPTIELFRLAAQAAKGLRDRNRATQLEALALFLETLDLLAKDYPDLARQKFKRARRAYPDLYKEPAVAGTLRGFLRRWPAARPRAAKLFRRSPEWQKLLRE